MYPLIRSLLFRLPPERAHALTIQALRLADALPPTRQLLRLMFTPPPMPVQAFGLCFQNPVGLAAGYDKDALAWRGLACLGFGHIEVGTVTPRPQPGNPQPRLFRLSRDRALINRMGFPGRGADFVYQHLKGRRPKGLVLGVNLGKNKDTPLEDAARDYLELYRSFNPLADYLAINISSPNTVGLRRLQSRAALLELLTAIIQERRVMHQRGSHKTPILVKLAPDLTDDELDDALLVILETGMDGIIATNTTITRAGLKSPLRDETGGLSGAPLRQRSTEMIHKIVERTGGKLPVIGVGGIASADDARQKLDAGATLVQVYTGMVYAGPGLVKSIVRGLCR